MTRTFLLLCIFFGFLLPAIAQEDVAIRSPEDVRKSLKNATTDDDRASILLDEAIAYVLKPGSEKSDMDSAWQLIQQAGKINNTLHNKHVEAKSLFASAKVLHDKGDTAAGHMSIAKAIAIYNTLDFPNELGEAYSDLISYFPLETLEDVAEIVTVCENALSQFRKSGNKRRQADVLKDLADYNQISDKQGLALVQLKEALALYVSIGHKGVQGVYDLMGTVSEYLGDYANAVQYGLLAVKTAEATQDTTMQLCTIYNRLAMAYFHWSKNEEADLYFGKAMVIAEKYKDKSSIDLVLVSLVTGLVAQNKWEECLDLIRSAEKYLHPMRRSDSVFLFQCYSNAYVQAKQYDKAKYYVDALMGLESRFEKNNMQLRSIFLPVNTYFMATKQYALAEKYTNAFFNLATEINYKPDIVHGYLLKAKLDSASGNLAKALQDNYLYNKMKDSLLNETKSFQFAQMQVAYETEKKDNNIQLLTAQNAVQEATFRKASLIRNIIIISILLLLVFAFTAYKFKQRNNAKLQAQQQEINQQNSELKNLITEKNQLLTEKEWLVKEIHHRVKNNLQIIISLLNTQSNYLDNKEAIAAISESRHRMQAMSLIHQKLYQSDNTKLVNMQVYIHELAEYLEASFADNNKISFTLDIGDINLDITQAIPLGLILNESITNSIKYAFAPGENGSIRVQMHNDHANKIQLGINDNGKGFPDNFNIDESNSMGMILIRGLVKQIGGELGIGNDHGARIWISFTLDKSLKLAEQVAHQV